MRDARANASERLLTDANEPSPASPAPNLPARDPLVQLAKVQCNGEEYIAADDVKAEFPQLFQGCGRNTRGILKRASPGGSPILKSSDHVFATQKKAGWMAAEGSNKRAKLLVTPAWVHQQICLNSTQADENQTVGAQSAGDTPGAHMPETRSRREYCIGVDAEAHEASDEPSADDGADDGADQNAAPADLEDAPEVLSLEEAEKFQNEDGEPQEVETRGVRAANGIFFRANDVSLLVSEHRLWVTNRVTHPNSSFERGPDKDFVSFKVLVNEDGRPRACSRLFLTYRGLVRVMNVSRTPAARRFCDWAAALLQAAQMGSREQRQEAAASILKTPIAKVREALSSFSPKPSGVYLLSLGTVGQLRKSMEIANDIPDAHVVLKWGETGDLDDRIRKHLADYGRIRGATVELVKFIYIDSSHLTTCEATMARYFREAGWLLRSSGHEVLQGGSKRFKPRVELAAVPKASLKHVQAFYDGQQAMYGGNVKEFVARLNALQDQIGHERALYEEKLARKDDAIAHKTEMIARLEAMLAQQEEMASLRAIAHRYELAEARRR
ncbi:hypothetical protein BDZ88DRAFT_470638 [Geranomyces variabilis]|nr:hypothetical protein BDZ88DRAFT_470638 [Geranomyces variabilis]KAJ3134941.1 hypothetical protein HDU90_004266 [Geranomyces variabilis]